MHQSGDQEGDGKQQTHYCPRRELFIITEDTGGVPPVDTAIIILHIRKEGAYRANSTDCYTGPNKSRVRIPLNLGGESSLGDRLRRGYLLWSV